MVPVYDDPVSPLSPFSPFSPCGPGTATYRIVSAGEIDCAYVGVTVVETGSAGILV